VGRAHRRRRHPRPEQLATTREDETKSVVAQEALDVEDIVLL